MSKNKKDTFKVKVTVTQSDIKAGCHSDEENCPVNIATTRALTGVMKKTFWGRVLLANMSVSTAGVPNVDFNLENEAVSDASRKDADRVQKFIDTYDSRGELEDELNDAYAAGGAPERDDYDLKSDFREDLEAFNSEKKAVEKKIAELSKKLKPFSFTLVLSLE